MLRALLRHSENPAARVLEARWRLANELTDHAKVIRESLAEKLDERPQTQLLLESEEMERLGGEEKGYTKVRKPTPCDTDFKHRFALNSEEHTAWLAATGTI